MRRRFWLASYPKSGNTWFRLLLANLRADQPADINRLPTEPALASARAPFDRVTLVASGLLTPHECDLIRPAAYRAMARIDDPEEDEGPAGIDDTIFVKTHDGWTRNAAGEAMLGQVRFLLCATRAISSRRWHITVGRRMTLRLNSWRIQRRALLISLTASRASCARS